MGRGELDADDDAQHPAGRLRRRELRIVVPDGVRDDLTLSTDSARERLEAGISSPPRGDVLAANERLQNFARDNCDPRTG